MPSIYRVKTAVLIVVVLLLGLGATAGQAEDLWIHVQVREGDDTSVNVNLPLGLIEKALPLIPQDEISLHGGAIHIDGVEWSMQDLRELWVEIQNSPDMTFVSVEEVDESVRISKSGEHLLVAVEERSENGERVDIKVPLAVVEALLAGTGEELRIEDALRALADHGEGDLVSVESDSESVRVWIDDASSGAS